MRTQNIKLTLLTIFLLLGLSLSAQKKSILGDFKIGANFSEMDIAGANMYKEPRLGFSFGGNVSFRLFSSVYLQSGFFLTKKGLSQHNTDIEIKDESIGAYIEQDLKQTVDVNYMQVPLSLGLELPLNKSLSINMYGGAYGGYAFRGYVIPYHGTTTYWAAGNKNVTTVSAGEEDIFETRRIKRFDYGAIGSVGLVWDIYTLTFTYEHGLYDIADINALADDGSGTKKELRNRNMSLALGFRF